MVGVPDVNVFGVIKVLTNFLQSPKKVVVVRLGLAVDQDVQLVLVVDLALFLWGDVVWVVHGDQTDHARLLVTHSMLVTVQPHFFWEREFC